MPGEHRTRAELLSRIAALQAELAQMDTPAPTAAHTPEPDGPRGAPPLEQGGRPGRAPADWAWLAIPLLLGVISALVALRIKGTWLPPMLLPVLTITFQTLILWLVSVLAARSYLRWQSGAALYLGCGALALGLGTALSALLAERLGANWAVAVFQSAACASGLFHIASAIVGTTPARPLRRSGWAVPLLAYLVTTVLVSAMAILARVGLWPVFFVSGSGDTAFGMAVAWVNVALFAICAVMLGLRRGQNEAGFFRWYALGLGLMAVGLAGVSLQANLGDALNWAGRTAQYLGGVYMLTAALSSARQGGAWTLPLEQALREVQERYRRLVELSPDGIVVHAGGRYIFVNPAAAKLFGAATPGELVGREVLATIHPDNRAVVAQRMVQVREGTTAPQREMRILRLDGSLGDVEATSTRVEFEGQPAVLVVIRDISERIRAEAALRQSEERFRMVLRGSPITVSMMDTSLRYTWVHNPAIPTAPTEFVGQRAEDMMPPESVAELTTLRRAVLESGVGRRQQLCVPLPDGPHWYDMTIQPVCDATGQVVGVSNVAMDTTERVEAERARALVEEALHRTSERLQAYLKNTPLAVLEMDAEYRLIRWSGEAERIFGWSAEEALGKTIGDLHLVPDDERVRIDQLVADMRSGHVRMNIHPNRNQRKDGAVIHCEWYNSPTLDAEGRFVSQLALALDVTQRVQAEEAVRASEERFATLFRAAPVPMALSRLGDGIILDVNEAWVRLFGFTLEENLGHSAAEVGLWMGPGARHPMVQDMTNERGLRDRELVFCTKGGESRDLLVSAETIPMQGQQVVLCALLDVTARKRAEEALRETRDLLDNLLNYANAPVIVWDPAFRITRFNHAFEHLTGYRAEEVLGESLEILFPVADREQAMEHIRQTSTGERWESIEIPILGMDGRVHTALWNSATLYAVDGVTPVATIAQGQDITERKRAGEALRESEERLRHVLENARDIIFGRNLLTGRYDYFSPAVIALTGYTVDEVTSMGPEQTIALIHPDDRANYVASTRAIIASSATSPTDTIEYRWLTRSGDYRWFSMTRRLVRDREGRAASLVGTIRDIHEAKQIEQERYITLDLLRMANNAAGSDETIRAVLSYLKRWLDLDALAFRLRQGDDYPYLVTEGFPDHFVQAESSLCVRDPLDEPLCDASGNPIVECMCGTVLCGRCDPAQPFFTAYGSFWTNSTTELLASSSETKPQGCTRGRCHDAGYESVALIPLRASGETLGLLQINDHQKGRFTPHLIAYLEQTADEIARSYAEKRAREALRELNATLEAHVEARTAELQQRTEQLRQLAGELTRAEERERRRVAQVLHDDLQQVLVAARLNLHGLAAMPDPTVAQAAKRVDGLLGQSIGISRSLTAQLSPPVLYELGLAAGLHWLARWMEQNHHLKVTLQAEPQAEPPQEDMRALLFQCVRELLLNTSKHAGVGRAQVSLTLSPDECILVTVSDDGVGFDPAQVAHGQSQSGGMGLFSLRERLGLIGGAMEVQSAPGRGTSITLRVPLPGSPTHAAISAPGTVMAAPAAPRTVARVLRVLVVDDHTMVRQGIAGLLDAEADIEVVGQAEDGLRAVELARELRPDVILMDISMPHLGGIEATQRILAELPEARILALTMHDDSTLEAAMRQAGAVGYVSKGGPTAALLAAIRSAC